MFPNDRIVRAVMIGVAVLVIIGLVLGSVSFGT